VSGENHRCQIGPWQILSPNVRDLLIGDFRYSVSNQLLLSQGTLSLLSEYALRGGRILHSLQSYITTSIDHPKPMNRVLGLGYGNAPSSGHYLPKRLTAAARSVPPCVEGRVSAWASQNWSAHDVTIVRVADHRKYKIQTL